MLTIRFSRVGKKNKPQYKIALQEKTAAPKGGHVEILGSHDPHSKQTVLKEDRIKFWIDKGAQLSDTVHNLLVTKGVITDKKKAVKIPAKKAEETPVEGGTPVAEKASVENDDNKKETPETHKEEKKEETPVKSEEASEVKKEEPIKTQEEKKEEKKPEEAPKEAAKKE